MSARARYDGPHDAVDVYPWGTDGPFVKVERGHQLPAEIDGKPVPAAVRDELIARADWSEVAQTATKKES